MAAYCTTRDLGVLGIRFDALRGIPDEDLLASIQAASDTIDSYLRDRWKLPLIAWGSDIKRCCAILAVYEAIAVRGLNPNIGGDEVLQNRHDQQIGWLRDIAADRVTPELTDSSTGSTDQAPSSARAEIISNSQRGWYDDGDGCVGAFVGGR